MKIRLGQKRVRSPFAVCQMMKKRHKWSKAKFKRCAEQIKRLQRGRRKKR